MGGEVKTCIICHVPKPLADFPYHLKETATGDKVYYEKKCIKCKSSLGHKSFRYSLTPEQFNLMLKSQNGVCAICEKKPTNSRGFHIDHDHATGKVRGLLCHQCNSLLGMAKDSLTTLKAAMAYLEAHL